MRTPLPDDLPAAFATRDALRAGVTRSRLRASDLERPFHGSYLAADRVLPGDDRAAVLERAAAAVAVLDPRAFLSHVTAAVLWRVPLPFSVDAARPPDIGMLHPARPPRLTGVRAHRVQARHVRVIVDPETGLRVASPASTWAMLGAVLRHPYDLVAAGDALVSDRVYGREGALATIAQFEAAAFAGRRVGINALRAALPRVRPRVASRTESWSRLVLVDAGLPEPEVNVDVRDAAGRLLACVDLAYPDLRVAIEYEGGHHLFDGEQWARDIGRYERLAAAGWIVIRVTSRDLFVQPAAFAARVRAARRAAA